MTAAAAVPIFVAHLAITARLRSPHSMDMSGWAGHAQASALLIASKQKWKIFLCDINTFLGGSQRGGCRWGRRGVSHYFCFLCFLFFSLFFFFSLRFSSSFFAFFRFSPILPGRERKRLQFTVKMGNFTPTPSARTPFRTSRTIQGGPGTEGEPESLLNGVFEGGVQSARQLLHN